MDLTRFIKQKAIELGFDAAGITDASPISPEHIERLRNWLNTGCAAGMEYMHRNLEKRIDPGRLMKGAKSVICLCLNYKPPIPEISESSVPMGRIAHYARYEDYHRFIKDLLYKLCDFIRQRQHKARFKVCVDSAPLAERALAERAGLGFIGKNHMLINPQLGPQLFLAEIITDIELTVDRPIEAACKSCNRCIDACPTAALRANGPLDARRCISYLTIEHKGAIQAELAVKIGDRLFGCDECVIACPYQQKALPRSNNRFRYYPDRAKLNLAELINMTPQIFEERLGNSPLLRCGLERLKRNARICLENISGADKQSR